MRRLSVFGLGRWGVLVVSGSGGGVCIIYAGGEYGRSRGVTVFEVDLGVGWVFL